MRLFLRLLMKLFFRGRREMERQRRGARRRP
jgi:hypothetical protein